MTIGLAIISGGYFLFGVLLLNNTLHSLLHNELGASFHVRENIVLSFGPDSGAVWLVEFDDALDVNQVPQQLMGFADDSDDKYYKKSFQERFNLPPGFIDSYILFRGEKPLGSFTICDSTHCNFELLLDKKGKIAFIGISKT